MSINFGIIVTCFIVMFFIIGISSLVISMIYEPDNISHSRKLASPFLEKDNEAEKYNDFKPSQNLFDFIDETNTTEQ